MSEHFFPPDFATSRQLFRDAASNAQGELHHLPLDVTDPHGRSLGIDIAWFGDCQPKRALVHVSGIHGVEGFAGAAVQLALLKKLPVLAADSALILVHVLNPYGMAHLRRSNANNVDLNRNFFFDTGGWTGTDESYAALNPLLNPPRPPSRIDLSLVLMLWAQARLGRDHIRQVVAGGQYRFSKGVFYGGNGLEPEAQRYSEWLGRYLDGVQELLVIDLHTGLGSYGQQTLFLRSPLVTAAELAGALQLPIASDAIESTVMGYAHLGGHSNAYQHMLPTTRAIFLTEEFGTFSGHRLLRALRAENQHHHFGDRLTGHWSKQNLKRVFCPDDAAWRRRTVEQGCDLVHRATALLASGKAFSPTSFP